MKVPISAIPVNDKLIIYRNGKSEEVDLPFKPFILAEKEAFPEINTKVEKWIKVPENVEKEYYRCSFEDMDSLHEFRKRFLDKQRWMLANSYMEQVYISAADFMLQYPNSNDLKVLFFDIEVATKGDGFFPKPISNEVLCIGYSTWLYKNDGTKEKLKQEIIGDYDLTAARTGQSTYGDRKILREFVEMMKTEDPDIIAGYNSEEFDLPYIMDRCELLDIDMKGIGRNNKKPYRGRDGIKIPGRIHFDIYNSNAGVTKDQTLFGIKSRSLKEIARFYEIDIEDVELPEHIENLLELYKNDKDKLFSYLRDDVLRTEHVGHVYMRNCITLAELLKVPLNSIINMYSSFVPKLFAARNMEQLGLINTESNFQRYNTNFGSIAKLGTKYEGALVGLYKNGFFPKVRKLDFSSMYPSAIQTWNLGPDTTSYVDTLPYTGKYRFTRNGKYNWYRIPDKNFNCDVLIKVRNDKDGFLKTEIAKLREERVKIKKEMKEARANGDNEKLAALNSQQYAVKVILNSIYGLLGLKSSVYGDMCSAMMVTAMCRWTTGKVIRRYKDILVELDTDGLILDEEVDEDETNKWLDGLVEEHFGIKDNYMQMELDDLGRAYFYAMKNYVVEEHGDYIIHGSSMKASRAARIVDRAIKLGIEHVFNNKPKEEVLHEALDFDDVPLEDFTERVKLSKEPREYDDQLDMRLFLAEQMKIKTGQTATRGTQFSYVVTKNQLPQEEFVPFYRGGKNYTFIKYVEDKSELDYDHYKELVLKALEKFGVQECEQLSLFGDEGLKPKKPLDIVPDEPLEWNPTEVRSAVRMR